MSQLPGERFALPAAASEFPADPSASYLEYNVVKMPAPHPDDLLAAHVASAVHSEIKVSHESGSSEATDLLRAMLDIDPRSMSSHARATLLYFARELTQRYTPEGMRHGQ